MRKRPDLFPHRHRFFGGGGGAANEGTIPLDSQGGERQSIVIDSQAASATAIARHAELLATLELHEALRVYCLSARGPDCLRMGVANYLYQKGVLESNRVRLWSGGEQRELELIGFDISWEPTPSDRSPQVQHWLGDGIEAVQAGDGKRAERLFKKCLETAGDAPDLLNNLAGAYELQGRHDEGYRLLQEIRERWPDYFFGRISMANLAVAAGNFERAEEMLAPLLPPTEAAYHRVRRPGDLLHPAVHRAGQTRQCPQLARHVPAGRSGSSEHFPLRRHSQRNQ
jgi:tetratricopeptide (TPR) repeat protein